MPYYKVTKPRFWDGSLCGPGSKISVIHSDKDLAQPVVVDGKKTKQTRLPDGLERIPDPSASEIREQAKARKSAKQADAVKQEQDRIEEESITFVDTKPGAAPTVETL